MREILFRGKSVNDGNWVEGSLVVTTIEPADDTPIKHYHIENMTIGAFPDEFQSGLSETVNPNTVGQFTGLTDKNGKRIFEGDMVVSYDMFGYRDYCGVVNWNDLFVAWHIGEHSMYNRIATYEVIGNIHDNPELLEV